ncbi:MAG TPA: translocation/assembly module TamB domain-containing protein [Candidimonas sp.]|nr:translocation/assembly module TamB domain-containing protein [Candidimonas sp.]
MRRLFLWLGPLIVLAVLLFSSLLFWLVATPSGTRWALTTAAEQFDGEVRGASGTLWFGLHVDALSMAFPGVAVRVEDFHLHANWRELLDRRAHVHDLSASLLAVELTPAPEEAPGEPFKMPALPVLVTIDRLAVDDLRISQDGEALPVSIQNLSTSLAVTDAGGQLVVQTLQLGHEQMDIAIEGELNVLALTDPWPLRGQFTTHATGLGDESPLCARKYLSTLPAASGKKTLEDAPGAAPPPCTLEVDTRIEGDLEALKVVVTGSGQGMSLDGSAGLTPRAQFPLKDADVALHLADGSSLQAKLDWTSRVVDAVVHDRVAGSLRTEKLDIGRLLGPVIPEAVITTTANFDLDLRNRQDVSAAEMDLAFGEGSRWNKQALSGTLTTRIVNVGAPASPVSAPPQVPPSSAPPPTKPVLQWRDLQLAAIDMDLRLGKNRLRAQGALGASDSRLTLDAQAPELAAFWPDLPGGAQVKGDVAGTLAQHKATLDAQYRPQKSQAGKVGSAPASVRLALEGGWGRDAAPAATAPAAPAAETTEGWRGTLSSLSAEHAGLGARTRAPMALSFLPAAVAPAWQWQVGATRIDMLMSSRALFTVDHVASRGGAGRWESKGAIARLPLSPALLDEVGKKLGLQTQEEEDRGGVTVLADKAAAVSEIVLGVNWDMKFAGALAGTAHVERISGDVMVPAEPAFPLGLQRFSLDLNAKPGKGSTSLVTADLNVTTKKMGRVSATGSTLVHATPGGGLALRPEDVRTVNIDADIDDLGWTSLFLGDAMELGGALRADVQLKSRPNGTWATSGTLRGEKIRVIRIDDGVRLLDGTLSARLADDRLILDSLSFPARLRVEPKEWRTAEWVSTNPGAKGGSLNITGDWNLFDSRGVVDVELYRYPILQRADRYAMVSGKLRVAAELPKIAIDGSLTADAGWFDLDMLGGIPTVDSDVVVLRPGDDIAKVDVPMDISMDLDVDLGPRFYLTGYGVNSGLVGKLHIMMRDGKLTGIGALRTRGGAIETYGQRLQLRKGTITFQGDITSPVLDIEALRTGLAVEAGVRVAGTAKRPRIDLVSYPAVSEIEKLSWLLMGHGADESGGDMALLFSVGTSFLGSGEPFYRKFGIDEVSVKSGELGSAGSILPAESVVSGLDAGTSDIERKFIAVSKKLSNGITLSIQQALSDTGSVGRASYRLGRGLTAELSAGTINGLALVYRWFSRD